MSVLVNKPKELRAVDVDIFGDSITHDETVASVVS